MGNGRWEKSARAGKPDGVRWEREDGGGIIRQGRERHQRG